MVVFTCGHCGESVQKPKVEKHYMTKCRNRNPNLSCMDCFKDFLGNDYESHTKCITEEERYSGKGFQAKEKKGEKKQNAWVEILQSLLDEQKNAPSNVRRIIETVSKHNNTPRKKPKFVNFVKNVCGHKTNPKDIDQAWDLISVKLGELANVTKNNQNNKKTEENQNDSVNTSLDNNSAENGLDESSQNGIDEDKQNGHAENGESSDNKKLSKKERKEEKKRKKYEAELQSAEAAPEETEEIESQTKKGKKKKNKSVSESANGDAEDEGDAKGKNKKRKRLDTNVQEAIDAAENIPPVVAPAKEKSQKKKLKVEDELEESDTLHNQNVAKIEELSMKSDKFDWHAVIISVLEKKDNEMPFKRLQKKVLAEYMEATGRDVDDRIADKFIKKLKSAPKVRVDKNRVTLEI